MDLAFLGGVILTATAALAGSAVHRRMVRRP